VVTVAMKFNQNKAKKVMISVVQLKQIYIV